MATKFVVVDLNKDYKLNATTFDMIKFWIYWKNMVL